MEGPLAGGEPPEATAPGRRRQAAADGPAPPGDGSASDSDEEPALTQQLHELQQQQEADSGGAAGDSDSDFASDTDGEECTLHAQASQEDVFQTAWAACCGTVQSAFRRLFGVPPPADAGGSRPGSKRRRSSEGPRTCPNCGKCLAGNVTCTISVHKTKVADAKCSRCGRRQYLASVSRGTGGGGWTKWLRAAACAHLAACQASYHPTRHACACLPLRLPAPAEQVQPWRHRRGRRHVGAGQGGPAAVAPRLLRAGAQQRRRGQGGDRPQGPGLLALPAAGCFCAAAQPGLGAEADGSHDAVPNPG